MLTIIILSMLAIYIYTCRALVLHLQRLVGHKVNTEGLLTFSLFWPIMFIATLIVVSVAIMCLPLKELFDTYKGQHSNEL